MKNSSLFIAFILFSSMASAQISSYQRVDSLMAGYNEPVKKPDDLRGLWYFIYQHVYTDSLRLRAVVDWIAANIAYDVKSWQSGSEEAGQLEYVLRRKKAVCSGYASLLKYMCDLFKIECEVVAGRARAFDGDVYLRQSKLTDNHAWNMVKINNQWRLIDPTWIAGSVSGDADDPKTKFVPAFNETYYFLAPEKFILNHYPKQSRYQLLSPAVSETDFRTAPLYLQPFIDAGITKVAPAAAFITATAGDTIKFQFRTNNLTVEMLAWSPTQKAAEFKGETTRKDDVVEFNYPVSVTGSYNLYLGQVKGMRGEALLAYKLQVAARSK